MEEEKGKLIYILPNFFTAASAFLAVISIISTIKGNFSAAIFYIILSLICDGLDGRVARLTHATSKFGVEFDSLADIVAFLYRDDYYDRAGEEEEGIPNNKVEVIIEKNRSGARGTVELIFQKEYNKFSSISKREDE